MKTISCFLILLLLTSPVWASQESQVRQANELFKKQQWNGAIDHYLNALEQNQNADILQYDLGTAFYKKGNYEQSIEHLQKAFSNKNKDLSSRAYYNLGNALYKKGRSLENSNIDEAINSLQKSLINYQKVLNRNSKDKDAQYNQKFVEKELERLKKKKRQQQSSQQHNQSQRKGTPQQNDRQNQSQNSSADKKNKKNNENGDNKPPDQQRKQSQQNQNQSRFPEERQSQGMQQQQENMKQTRAQKLLDDYERDEAPKGLLNFEDRHRGDVHVDKDW